MNTLSVPVSARPSRHRPSGPSPRRPGRRKTRARGDFVRPLSLGETDPHDHTKPDAVGKAQGLSIYAAKHVGTTRGHINLTAQIDGRLRRLHLHLEKLAVCKEIDQLSTNTELENLYKRLADLSHGCEIAVGRLFWAGADAAITSDSRVNSGSTDGVRQISATERIGAPRFAHLEQEPAADRRVLVINSSLIALRRAN